MGKYFGSPYTAADDAAIIRLIPFCLQFSIRFNVPSIFEIPSSLGFSTEILTEVCAARCITASILLFLKISAILSDAKSIIKYFALSFLYLGCALSIT